MKLRPRKAKGKTNAISGDDSVCNCIAESPSSSDCSYRDEIANDSCSDEEVNEDGVQVQEEVPINAFASDESLSDASQSQTENRITMKLRKRKVQTNVSENGNRKKKKIEKRGKKKKAKPRKTLKRGKGKGKVSPKTPLMWEEWENDDNGWIDENLDADFETPVDVDVETANPSSNMVLPLLRYQKEWLAWAIKQENSPIKGGILADEMGMGKTLQAIALVISQREAASQSPSSSNDSNHSKTTLVVCPVVAVSQWVSEIDRFTSKGSTSVLVYHGTNRLKDFTLFSKYDFVITTYSTVESEYRKFMMPPKQRCQYCGKAFNSDKLRVHLKYFCGPDAVRTAKQSKQQRKQGKPVKQDEKNKEDEKLKKTVKQDKKNKEDKKLKRADDFINFEESNRGKSVLHSANWNRIILDEAHYIKDRRCNTAKAIFALKSRYKWALSGTPLQNRVGELYSLIRFLQIVPYSFYLCKNCDCLTLDHRAASACPSCPHNSVRHFCWWNRYVANPIQASASSEKGRRAMLLLKHKVLKKIVLRRTKTGRAADLALPARIITLRRDSLDIKEEDYYDSLYNESQSQFDAYVRSDTVSNNYAHIFDLLTRLRQAVDHPYLVVYSTAAAQRVGETCDLCHEAIEERVVASCAHAFCKGCLLDYSSSLGEVTCPTCSKPLTVDFNSDAGDARVRSTIKGFKSSSILNRVNLNEFRTSTKIEALGEEIRLMYERDTSAKALVFSQFTQFLDLIRYSLQKTGISCVQLEGSMTLASRDSAIRRFNEDADCRVFLMSLKAGGVALNLTAASHVFLMDPWWNPAVERQAQDRIHRIGQHKPIRTVKFVIENTIEERILRLQEKKELVFEGTVGGSADALGKLTEGDLRFLFAS